MKKTDDFVALAIVVLAIVVGVFIWNHPDELMRFLTELGSR